MPGKANELMLSDIEKEFSDASHIFFGRFSGLKVPDLFELRTSLRSAGRRCLVVRNQLARLALKKLGHESAGK
ncbi:MAG: 50S ribosomal protein L10, partial [Candidatus Omnitrophica bacterium]|nr:50S ribosomal protein L10 [Candidatus Omnitrophota bacterium]